MGAMPFLPGCSRRGKLFLACLFLGPVALAQQPKLHPGRAKLASQPFLILDNVATEQWPATLPLVNAPADIQYLSPGQCIRAAVVVTGDNHQKLISGVAIGFTIHLGTVQQDFPLAPPLAAKEVKPEGSDFVNGGLHAAGIGPLDLSTASMAASAARWCVPPDAQAGPLEVEVVATFQNKTEHLKRATFSIDSMTHPQVPFSNADSVSQWIMTYYRHPRPALLVPAISMLPPGQQTSTNMQEFLLAAFRADPLAASLLGDQVAAAPKPTQLLLVYLLSKAGVRLVHPVVLGPNEQTALNNAPPLPDQYDLAPNQQTYFKDGVFKLDMLWADFFATGSVKPVKTIASALAWRADYAAFEKLKESGKKLTLTDSILRAVTFGSAGWSLDSFDRTDPLVADYIAAMETAPDTPPEVKKELLALDTDPAFRQTPHR
jgi:hypothetical protein